jgi:hypothetical protein
MPKATGSYETVAIFSLRNEMRRTALWKNSRLSSRARKHHHVRRVEPNAPSLSIEKKPRALICSWSHAAPAFPADLDRIYTITDGVLRSADQREKQLGGA